MSRPSTILIGLCLWALATMWSLLSGERVDPRSPPSGNGALAGRPVGRAPHGAPRPAASQRASVPAPSRAEAADAPADSSYLQAGSEAPEPTALAAAERDLLERATDLLPAGSALRSLECQASECRIESDHADAEHLRTFVNELAVMDLDRSHPFSGSVEIVFEPSQERAELRHVAIAYFRRSAQP